MGGLNIDETTDTEAKIRDAVTGTGKVNPANLPTVSSGTAGIVPAAGTATTSYLRGDYTWQTIAGGGDMLKATYDPAAKNSQLASTGDLATHAALTASVHGAGTGGFAIAATTLAGYGIVDAAASSHVDAVNGVHGVGTASVASTANITTHSNLTNAVHGIPAGSTMAMTADIVTHSNLTGGIHGVAGTVLSASALVAHTVLTAAHGVTQIAGTADIATHAALTSTHGNITQPSGTIQAETTWAIAVNVGGSATYARGDHTHGTQALYPASTRLAGSQAFSGSAVGNVTGLTFACASTTYYHFRFLPIFNSGTTTYGPKFGVTVPAGTIAYNIHFEVLASGTTGWVEGAGTASGATVGGSSVASTAWYMAVIEGVGYFSAAGSIQLQAAANSATGTIWVRERSMAFLYNMA